MKKKRFIYSFEKLDVWMESKNLVVNLYKMTKDFPDIEKYGLTNQIRRAAVSVPANIAEGSAKYSKKDFSRYLQISYGSLMEVLSHIFIAKDLNYLSEENSDIIVNKIQSISNKLNSLNKSLKL